MEDVKIGATDGEHVRFGKALGTRRMVSSTTNDGAFGLVEHDLPAGQLGSPVHTHEREDEYSFVLSGRLTAQIGEDVIEAGPGELVVKPRGIPHAFWNNGSEPVCFLELISPGGFEEYFFERAGAERDEGLLAERMALYHPDIHMTSSLTEVTVRVHGKDELRRVTAELMTDNLRYRNLNTKVVVDEGDRAVLRTTLVVLQGDRPLVALPLEWEIALRDGLIVESHITSPEPEDQPSVAPLGSTLSLGGEILARWGDEQLLVRLYDGRPLELPAPGELDDDA